MNDIKDKRVLVTGASGFLGMALVHRLIQTGAQVYGVSRRNQEDGSGIKWLTGDLTDEKTARMIVAEAKPHIVYHLAGYADGARDLRLVESTFEQNALLTVHLLTAVAEHGCERFVYAGSMEEPDPFDATALPNAPYSAAKWVGTVYTRLFHRLYKLPTVALRIFLTYGPGPQLRTKLIPYTIATLLEGRSPEVSSGARLVDIVYIDDVVDAFVKAAAADSAVGETVEVGGGARYSLRQIVEAAAKAVGGGVQVSFGTVPDRPDEMMPTADIERSLRLLGWRPQITLDEGMKRTVAWYRRQLQKA